MRDDLLEIAWSEWRRSEKTSRVRASGLSMRPLIPDEAWLVVEHVEVADVAVGDIVVYRHGDRLITHRIVGCVSGGGDLYEHGDAGGPVRRIPSEALLGRVTAIETDSGTVDLDSSAWRLIGALIARYWMGVHRIDGAGLFLKKIFIGERSIPGLSRARIALLKLLDGPAKTLLVAGRAVKGRRGD